MTGMPRAGRRQHVAKAARVSEKAFMTAVIDYLRLRGWLVYHTWDSRKSAAGFPDIVAVRAGRICSIETKPPVGQLRPAQEQWLNILGGVPCAETFVLTSAEEHWQLIERAFH